MATFVTAAMTLASTHVLAAEAASEESAGATPYLIGATALLVLFVALFAVVVVGGGREHS